MTANPARSEVWLVDLGLVAKVRPCLVLSIPADDDNDRVLTTIVPHTTSTRESRFEVLSNVRFLKQGAFDAQNIVTIPTVKLVRCRAISFIKRQTQAKKPFFIYLPYTATHFPTMPHPDFKGKSGKGAWGDLLMQRGRAGGGQLQEHVASLKEHPPIPTGAAGSIPTAQVSRPACCI